MKEKHNLHKIRDIEERRLLSFVLDQEEQYRKTGRSTSSGFLNERELSFLEGYLNHLDIDYSVMRLSPACERSIIYFGEYEDFISVYYIRNRLLKHSDVLGSFFATGYTNSMLGDVFIQPDGVYFTNLTKYNPFLESSLVKIGKYPVVLERRDALPEIEKHFEEMQFILTSLRLDLVVAHLTHQSRSQVSQFLRENNVYVNFKRVERPILRLKEGDILSVQRVGKFRVKETVPLAKKGKVSICLEQYK